MKFIGTFFVCLASLLMGLPVHAQPADAQPEVVTPEQKATAELLYRKGIALFEAEKYEQACHYLGESLQQDPSMTTQYYLAQCLKEQGMVVSAWSILRDLVATANKAGMVDQETVARTEAEALEPRLPKLTIAVSPEVAALQGLTVARNGTPIRQGQLGLAMPVDPGEQRVQVRAPGYKPWEGRGTAREGAFMTISVGALQPDQPQPLNAVAPRRPVVAVANAVEKEGVNRLPVLGFVVAGLGVVGVATGMGLGAMAKAKNDSAECYANGKVCTQEGFQTQDESFALASVATGVVIGGAILTAAGITVALVSLLGEDDAEGNPDVLALGVGLNGVNLQGSW